MTLEPVEILGGKAKQGLPGTNPGPASDPHVNRAILQASRTAGGTTFACPMWPPAQHGRLPALVGCRAMFAVANSKSLSAPLARVGGVLVEGGRAEAG